MKRIVDDFMFSVAKATLDLALFVHQSVCLSVIVMVFQ